MCVCVCIDNLWCVCVCVCDQLLRKKRTFSFTFFSLHCGSAHGHVIIILHVQDSCNNDPAVRTAVTASMILM